MKWVNLPRPAAQSRGLFIIPLVQLVKVQVKNQPEHVLKTVICLLFIWAVWDHLIPPTQLHSPLLTVWLDPCECITEAIKIHLSFDLLMKRLQDPLNSIETTLSAGGIQKRTGFGINLIKYNLQGWISPVHSSCQNSSLLRRCLEDP